MTKLNNIYSFVTDEILIFPRISLNMSFPKNKGTQQSIDNLLNSIENNQAIVNHAEGDTLGVLCEFILVEENDDCVIFTVNGLHKCVLNDDYTATLQFGDEQITNEDQFCQLKDAMNDMIYSWEEYDNAKELVCSLEEDNEIAMNMICYWIYTDYREFLLKLDSFDDKLMAMSMIESNYSNQILHDFFDDTDGVMQ